MDTTPQVNETLRDWIKVNILKGCNHDGIAAEMVKNGFSLEYAKQIVAEIKSNPADLYNQSTKAAPIKDAPVDNKYIYTTPRISQSGNIIHTDTRDVNVIVRLREPVIAVFDNFMSEYECDKLVELASGKLQRSATVNAETGMNEIHPHRTSDGACFAKSENDFITMLENRISQVMNWPVEKGEGIQVMRYKQNCEYRAHFDYFDEKAPGSQGMLAHSGQRVSTLVMYLNNVEEGGCTTFPNVKLSVTPKKGMAAYFEYLNDAKQLDVNTLHSGDPVISGEKWIATKWMRERNF